jgi:hypothetical protein
MRLVAGKVGIAAYLLMLGYLYATDDILYNTLRQAVELNIAHLALEERTSEFLRLYLIRIMLFCLFASLLAVLSRNILPKVVTAVGLALWIYFSLPPNIPPQRILLKMAEEVCLIGGLLLIAGSEYIEASLFEKGAQKKEDWKEED